MELLTFTIAANETKEFRKAGRYLEIIAALAPIDVLFQANEGGQTDEMRGALVGLFSEQVFKAFQVKNLASVGQQITLMIADGKGGSRRAPGVVQVIDSAKSRVISDLEWIVSTSVTPATGASFTSVEIWNGTTDKGLAVKGISLSSDIAQSLLVGTNPAELVPTLVTGVNSKRVTAGGIIVQPTNVRANRRNSSLAADPVATLLCTIAMQANVRQDLDLKGVPIVIGPGAGLRIASNTVNAVLSFVFNGEVFDWTG